MAKIVLVGSLLLAYAYLWEGFGAIYGSDVAEKHSVSRSHFRSLCPVLLGKDRA